MWGVMDSRGFTEGRRRWSKQYATRRTPHVSGSVSANSPPGLRRAGPSRAKRSSSQWERRKHFSPRSPSPFFHSTQISIAASASSGSAASAPSRRFPKPRSRRSSGPWEDDCGDWPPAASRIRSKRASLPSPFRPPPRLFSRPPSAALPGVERRVLELTALAPGTAEVQLFARDAQAAARTGQQRALQSAAREIRMRVKRACLYHVIEVQPWSRLPERRYALIDYEP